MPYAADIAGAVSGAVNPKGAAGAVRMADMAKKQMNAVYRVVLSGYRYELLSRVDGILQWSE